MQCPVCDARLRAIEKFGVEIDICPECKGVWLDRGELEKIIQLNAGEPSVAAPAPDARPLSTPPPPWRDDDRDRPYARERAYDRRRHDDDDDDDRHERTRDDAHGRPLPHRRRNWLSELFEGFGD